MIDWANYKVTFNSERCTTWCLKESPMVYTIPEAEAREENLHMQYSQVQVTHGQAIRVQKLKQDAKLPSRGSTKAAGHDLFAHEDVQIPANGQKTIGTGIAIGLPDGTYGRIAPRSGLAVKHRLHVMAGVIDADYTGEVRVVLANQGDQGYDIRKGDKIAQLIIERIIEDEYQEVEELDSTTRGDQGFGSTDKVPRKALQIREITAKEFGRLHREGETTGILKWSLTGNDILFERINVSTELAIREKQRRQQDEGKKKVTKNITTTWTSSKRA